VERIKRNRFKNNLSHYIIITMDLSELSKEELVEYISNKNNKQKQYMKTYQSTQKGRENTQRASKKYYDANREKILEKKRAYYLKKKAEKAAKK
tara:strand:+ start:371 stop:652 length:282 start_codon:yes stop_codon:yes gene_type:complete